MRTLQQLERELFAIDGKSYGAYKRLKGTWAGEQIELCIDHVQGDPFATPSRVRLRIPSRVHGLPEALRASPAREVALRDVLLRVFAQAARRVGGRSGSGKSGDVIVDAGDAEILDRSGCDFDGDALEVRFRIGLPARGRRVLGRTAAELLTRGLPEAAQHLQWDRIDREQE